jgi:aminobenzoyl-glutamate transport protein
MGYVVLIPLAMAIYHSLGRHPLAGMAAAFAGVSGGYSANLLIGTVDPLLAGITQEAARLIDPAYEVHPAVNWYFMIVSTFFITGAGWFVTARIVEPRLGTYDDAEASTTSASAPPMEPSPASSAGPAPRRAQRGGGLASGSSSSPGPTVPGVRPRGLAPRAGACCATPDPDGHGPEAFRPLLRSVVTMIVIFFVVPASSTAASWAR